MYYLSLKNQYTFGECAQYTHQFLRTFKKNKPVEYNKASFYGGQNMDYIWTLDREATSKEITDSREHNFVPEWTPDTLILANFNGQIHGGSIVSLTENVENWIVYRQKQGDSKLSYVAKIPVGDNFLIDYSVANQKEYQYVIFPETENTIGAPMTSDFIKTDWWNWSISGIKKSLDIENLYYIDTENIWLFDLEISSSEVVQNIDKQVVETMSKFNKLSIGETNYLTSGFSCYLGNVILNSYNDNSDIQNKFNDFASNSDLKILKDRKGNAYIIDIISNSSKVTDELEAQPSKITIQWIQLDELDKYSIIE